MSSAMDDRTKRVVALWDSIGDDYGAGSPFLVENAVSMVERAQLRMGERVIDLGTGNGHGLVPAARAVAPAQVVGVDLSDVMLEAARRRVRAAGLDNVELRNMDVSALAFPDASFDVALASTVFQFTGYSVSVLVEWHRVLVAGGRLLLSVPVSLGYPFDELLRDYFSRLPEPLRAAYGAAGQAGSPNVPDLVGLCSQAGYVSAEVEDVHRVQTFPDFDSWWAFHWTHGIRAFLAALPPDALDDMRTDASRLLAPKMSPNGEVAMETTGLVCTAIA
jgi:SAM-dependent methyltransferase